MSRQEHICVVLPSLKISGGNRELLGLADDLVGPDRSVTLLSMWRSPHELPTAGNEVRYLSEWKTNVRRAVAQLPLLLLRFSRLVSRRQDRALPTTTVWIFSHYSTLPLAFCVRRDRRWFFVQDLEWRFLSSPLLVKALKRVILFCYSRGRVISANPYLTSELSAHGVQVQLEAPIWANAQFNGDTASQREIDVTMVLRKGHHKRTDLYLECLRQVRAAGKSWRVAVITPEDEIRALLAGSIATCLVRPTAAAMCDIYARSRIFLHLSEHEGFGLPPLEAMGSGCVPVCRDSGGIRAYMTGDLQRLVYPLDLPMSEMVEIVDSLLKDGGRLAALSLLAKQVFDEGATQASSRRHALSQWQFERHTN
jgi:glycosyltransferase involved in cell wall biosynthesis